MTDRPTAPEVLAPAGSLPALLAALHHGADAVYFGLSDGFNARARAANFGIADLPAICARIHRAGARAYLTLNTLVFEPELEAVERVLRAAASAGVDALIVQDPAVCLLARAICPELELHASTQMTICEPAAAAFAAALGVTRVVVPRELSVEEIRTFAAGTDLELEVFVHGALCVSWSGQCLTSEAWGGRSANRGQCAQSCRMPYELVVDDQRRDLGDVRYLLSPKDLAGARAVPELAGLVHGLKIEGRQKGPQYVATAVAGYRRWLDAIVAGDDRRQAERQLAQDLLAMALSYSRGFSDGFLDGSDHQTLVEGRFPKHRGIYVGRVARVLDRAVVVERSQPAVAASDTVGVPAPLALRKGMGVVFDQGDPEDKHEPGGPLFFVDERGDELRLGFGEPGPDLARVRPGDRVFATSDPSLAASAATGEQEPSGRVAVDLAVQGRLGEPLTVLAHCRHARAECRTAVPLAAARGVGIDATLLRAKLGAFGGTPFALGGLDASGLAPGLHVPPGELKELRRRLTATLLPQLEAGPARTVATESQLATVRRAARARIAPAAARDGVAVVPLVREPAQLDAAIDAGCREVELDWMEFTGLGRAVERARAGGIAVTIATPRIGKPGEEALLERIRRLEPDGVLVRHFGALMRFVGWRVQAGDRCALHGDFALNATNSITLLHLLGHGLETVTAALDLDETQLFALLEHVPGDRLAVIAHHRIPTFHTEHCVYAHLLGTGRDFRTCGRPCERHRVALRDHIGREHPVIVDVGCRNTVFHHEPQQGAPWLARLAGGGVRRFRVEFVRETAAEVATVLGAMRALVDGRIDAAEYAARTGAAGQIGVAAGGMRLLTE